MWLSVSRFLCPGVLHLRCGLISVGVMEMSSSLLLFDAVRQLLDAQARISFQPLPLSLVFSRGCPGCVWTGWTLISSSCFL